MIKEVVTFEDFDNKKVTEVLWFHLSKGELLDWLTEEPDLAENLVSIAEGDDKIKLVSTFRGIIAKAYGERLEGDSTRFLKSKDRTDAFMSSPALDALLFDVILADEKHAAVFFNGIFPADWVEEVQAQVAGGAQVRDIATGKKLVDVGPKNVRVGPAKTPSEEPIALEEVIRRSGLANPYGKDGQLVTWAYRDPTPAEQTKMTHAQLQECMQRRMSGWEPPEAI